MISAPPQHGKSELAAVRLPAYWLGRFPDDPIILASYAASLAHSKSRHARNVVENTEYAEVFPDVQTDPTSRAVDHWELRYPHRGGLIAAGVGGPITGHGAMLGIIDDPFENWAQAQSENQRRKILEWYRGTFRTRIWENGVIVIIMTRWHEDDLVGSLLQEQGEQWTILRLPALAETQADRDHANKMNKMAIGRPDPLNREPGEALCPSRYSAKELRQIESDVGPTVFSAEYQGAPSRPEGNRFKRGWFKSFVRAAPMNARRCRYWDLAATADGGDQTAGVLIAIDDNGRIYIEDVVCGHWDTDERNDVMLSTTKLDAERQSDYPVYVRFEKEPGSAGKDAALAIMRLLQGFPVRPDPVTGSKDVRLEPFTGQAAAGNVSLVYGDWNQRYINEMCSIPFGKFRDQGDGTSGAYNTLAGSLVTVEAVENG